MRPDEFEARMRALEAFHPLRLPPRAWLILRLDGRGFSRFTETSFEKPFDARFHDGRVQTARGHASTQPRRNCSLRRRASFAAR